MVDGGWIVAGLVLLVSGISVWLSHHYRVRTQREMASLRAQLKSLQADRLREQQPAADEGWTHVSMERPVMSRTLPSHLRSELLSTLKALHFKPISLIAMQEHEPRQFALEMMLLLTEAGMLKRYMEVPPTAKIDGLIWFATDDEGQQLSKLLSEKYGLRSDCWTDVPNGLDELPTDANCLIIGRNNRAFQL